jgi:hypothetical protein
MSYSFGDIYPLGAHRLAIMEYFLVLLGIGLDPIFDEIVRLKIVEIGLVRNFLLFFSIFLESFDRVPVE